MGFQISPGVNVSEIDLSQIVPGVATTDTAFCGPFQWGPVNEIVTIDSENELYNIFRGPANPITIANNDGQAEEWFTAASFLAYGRTLHVVRAVGDAARNAYANSNGTAGSSRTNNIAMLIENADHFSTTMDSDDNAVSANVALMAFTAKYPGILGNSLDVYMVGATSGTGSDDFIQELNVSNGVSGTINTYQIVINDSTVNAALYGGATLTIDHGRTANVAGVYTIASKTTNNVVYADSTANLAANTTTINLTSALDGTFSNAAVTMSWPYASYFSHAPNTTEFARNIGAEGDELSVVVIDAGGAWSGVPGTVLETFPLLSAASNAKKYDGTTNYWMDVINAQSRYVWAVNAPDNTNNWGETANSGLDYSTTAGSANWHFQLRGGVDANNSTTDQSFISHRITGYRLFEDPETTEISLIIMGNSSYVGIQDAIDNIALKRLDCVVFFSPEPDATIGHTQQYDQCQAVIDFKNLVNRSTSFYFMDSTHKLMYDRYNDRYVTVPMNGDTAGLAVRTDETNDPWWSFAGLNRGKYKNVVKLFFNPRKTYRDQLYKNNINPVVSFPGEGPLLFGDKTGQTKASAFDRINVRRLFIVLEKAISRASKYLLFEFNDAFTRAQFRNMVEPFLADVKARRGIYDYKVVCNESNNTAEVIDRNEFVGDIYIKPTRSINFIQLNFIAARTGVDFSEIGG